MEEEIASLLGDKSQHLNKSSLREVTMFCLGNVVISRSHIGVYFVVVLFP
jgi:hypothetical protein